MRKIAETLIDIGSPTRARTWDLRINSPSLYQLSYRGFDAKSGDFTLLVRAASG
jgi:hypothetical protein